MSKILKLNLLSAKSFQTTFEMSNIYPPISMSENNFVGFLLKY